MVQNIWKSGNILGRRDLVWDLVPMWLGDGLYETQDDSVVEEFKRDTKRPIWFSIGGREEDSGE